MYLYSSLLPAFIQRAHFDPFSVTDTAGRAVSALKDLIYTEGDRQTHGWLANLKSGSVAGEGAGDLKGDWLREEGDASRSKNSMLESHYIQHDALAEQ